MGKSSCQFPWSNLTISEHCPHVQIFNTHDTGKITLDTQLKHRPQPEQSEGRVTMNVVRVVHEVLVPFQVQELHNNSWITLTLLCHVIHLRCSISNNTNNLTCVARRANLQK